MEALVNDVSGRDLATIVSLLRSLDERLSTLDQRLLRVEAAAPQLPAALSEPALVPEAKEKKEQQNESRESTHESRESTHESREFAVAPLEGVSLTEVEGVSPASAHSGDELDEIRLAPDLTAVPHLSDLVVEPALASHHPDQPVPAGVSRPQLASAALNTPSPSLAPERVINASPVHIFGSTGSNVADVQTNQPVPAASGQPLSAGRVPSPTDLTKSVHGAFLPSSPPLRTVPSQSPLRRAFVPPKTVGSGSQVTPAAISAGASLASAYNFSSAGPAPGHSSSFVTVPAHGQSSVSALSPAPGSSSPSFPPKDCFVFSSGVLAPRFGRNTVKIGKLYTLDLFGFDRSAVFTGESADPLSDLLKLCQAFVDVVERHGLDQNSGFLVLRHRLLGKSAYYLVESCQDWIGVLSVLFATFATEQRLVVFRNGLHQLKMQPGENALTFARRARRQFDLFGAGIAANTRVDILLEALQPAFAHSRSVRAESLWQYLLDLRGLPNGFDLILSDLMHTGASVSLEVRMPGRNNGNNNNGNNNNNIANRNHNNHNNRNNRDRQGQQASQSAGADAERANIRCFDCGVPGVRVNHAGCSAPGSGAFRPTPTLAPAGPSAGSGIATSVAKSGAKSGNKASHTAPKTAVKRANVSMGPVAGVSESSKSVFLRLSLMSGLTFLGLLDSGCTQHCMAPEEVARLGLDIQASSSPLHIETAKAGSPLSSVGTVLCEPFVGRSPLPMVFHVIPGISNTLVSYRSLVQSFPGSSWGANAAGVESIVINNVPFVPDLFLDDNDRPADHSPNEEVWIPASFSSDEFSALADRSQGTEAFEDEAFVSSRYSFSAFSAVSVMMRSSEMDLASLERIQSSMRSNGAPEHAITAFADLVFYPSEKKRLEAFADSSLPPSRGHDFEILFKKGAQPFHSKPKLYPPTEVTAIEMYTSHMVSTGQGRIGAPAEATCISNFTTPMPVKPNGDLRPCGSYVRLNSLTEHVPFHMTSWRELLDSFKPYTINYGVDVESAFHRVPVTDDASRKLGLWMPDGKSVFFPLVMPFGPTNAPAFFAHNVGACIRHLDDRGFADDIHGGGGGDDPWMDAVKNMAKLCDTLCADGFYPKFSKVNIGPEVPFLGNLRSAAGVRPDPQRLQILRELPAPSSLDELRSDLGALEFVAPFVPGNPEFHGLNEAMGQFSAMLSKNSKVQFPWSSDLVAKWKSMLNMLADAIPLHPPDFSRPFYLDTDASRFGWGYVLYQELPNNVRSIIALGSKAFRGSMASAAPVHQEAHAVVHAVIECERWLAYVFFIIRCDHRPLIWLLRKAEINPRLWGGKACRWVLLLQTFYWAIEHVPGLKHVAPDGFSRVRWPESAVVKRAREPSLRVSMARRRPALIQQRLDAAAEDLDSPPPLLVDDDDDEDDLTVSSSILSGQHLASQGVFSRPPLGLDVDVFEAVAIALLRNEPIPVHLADPRFAGISSEVRKHIDDLELRSNRLFHRSGVPYVRVEERAELVFLAHSDAAAAHRGIDVTLDRISSRAWWPSMRADITNYVSLCGICQRNKSKPAVASQVQPLPIANVFERAHMDLMGPFPPSPPNASSPMRYIFTLRDAASKYMVLAAIPDKSAETVSSTLTMKVFLRFGCPAQLVSDQGTEFVNDLNLAIASRIGLEHRPTAPYHPASNGLVERSHYDINTALRCLCEPDQSNWADAVPFVEFSLNTARSSVTGFTPFFLMFGRNPWTSLDLRLDLPPPAHLSVSSFLARLLTARELAANLDGRARAKAAEVANRSHTRAKPASVLVPGDLVLVRFTGTGEGLSAKLSPVYQGPFRVLSVRNGNTAVLENVRNPSDKIERHFERLVRFRGSASGPEALDRVWEVSSILDEVVEDGVTFFLVRWKGAFPGSDSWVAEADLQAPDLLDSWRKSRSQAPIVSVVSPAPIAAPKVLKPKKVSFAKDPSGGKKKRGAKKKAAEKEVSSPLFHVDRVVQMKRGEDGKRLFQVSVTGDQGPNDYKWVKVEQVANPSKLEAFLTANVWDFK